MAVGSLSLLDIFCYLKSLETKGDDQKGDLKELLKEQCIGMVLLSLMYSTEPQNIPKMQ